MPRTTRRAAAATLAALTLLAGCSREVPKVDSQPARPAVALPPDLCALIGPEALRSLVPDPQTTALADRVRLPDQVYSSSSCEVHTGAVDPAQGTGRLSFTLARHSRYMNETGEQHADRTFEKHCADLKTITPTNATDLTVAELGQRTCGRVVRVPSEPQRVDVYLRVLSGTDVLIVNQSRDPGPTSAPEAGLTDLTRSVLAKLHA
ncbi:hypothetical protein Val02_32800 [Virgisporangium aliadipatigenens]|uniref:DUF3558 domain-containing protein n=1 Tax=Virgisporangium aliadipatigenens TaxID=741659 RepID=A0A8J3YJ76_9ACTN|nr:hypothetical protein [Virgisporangium aliadipatigenens]GIJ46394.1 hypothetical protein Val02_32800 [Virgisporangium aliadipatigenens]